MLIAVCLAPVPRWAEVDPLSGELTVDERAAALGDADAAALEVALTVAAAWGATVVAVTLGPASADGLLREALACGAARAVRIDDAEPGRAEAVARALASVVAGADLVCCGDQGPYAGTGAVPAFLAGELGAAAALGLIEVGAGSSGGGALSAVRRLDGGRREHLAVPLPAVLSVEGAAARLRRAGLPGVLRAAKATIEVVTAGRAVPSGPSAGGPGVRSGVPRPYRPRPRRVAPPVGDRALDRVRALTGAGREVSQERRAPVAVEPEAAARLIVEALERWGYERPERAGP